MYMGNDVNWTRDGSNRLFWLLALILITGAVFIVSDLQAQPEEPTASPSTITLSVRDNAPDSSLNAARVINAVVNPGGDPGVHSRILVQQQRSPRTATLYQHYSAAGDMSALLLESQLSLSEFATYTLPQPGLSVTHIGYAFPNFDSDADGLPDGVERLYGLNRFSVDGDCDGFGDGVEFPIAGIQAAGNDPLSGGTCP